MKKILFSGCCGVAFLASQAQALDWCSNYSNNDCGSGEFFYGSAEYLYWGVKDSSSLPPLVISSTDPTIVSDPSLLVLGNPLATTVLGGGKFSTHFRSGGRFSLGYWFDEEHSLGLEGSYLFLAKKSKSENVSSNGLTGSATLAVPFYNVTTALQDSIAIASSIISDISLTSIGAPAFAGAAVLKQSNYMQGAELNLWIAASSDYAFKAGWLLGFRYWNFDEDLDFNTSSLNVPETLYPSDIWVTQDEFHVKNNFYGGQIGFGLETACDQFYLNGKFKVAVGAMCINSNIDGQLFTNDFNTPAYIGDVVEYVGGYFALPSNIGHHKTTKFAVIPEIDLNIGYQFTDSFRVQLGYTAIFVNNVSRASKQIDVNINPTQSIEYGLTVPAVLVGAAVPTGSIRTSGFWAQGLNAGVEFQF